MTDTDKSRIDRGTSGPFAFLPSSYHPGLPESQRICSQSYPLTLSRYVENIGPRHWNRLPRRLPSQCTQTKQQLRVCLTRFPTLPRPRLAEPGPDSISATSRQDSHLEKLRELGFKPVKASLDDRDLIVKLISEHDVVINTASSDHPESVQSTLDGIQKRIDAGKQTVYLHTSVRTSASYAFTTPT